MDLVEYKMDYQSCAARVFVVLKEVFAGQMLPGVEMDANLHLEIAALKQLHRYFKTMEKWFQLEQVPVDSKWMDQ